MSPALKPAEDGGGALKKEGAPWSIPGVGRRGDAGIALSQVLTGEARTWIWKEARRALWRWSRPGGMTARSGYVKSASVCVRALGHTYMYVHTHVDACGEYMYEHMPCVHACILLLTLSAESSQKQGSLSNKEHT